MVTWIRLYPLYFTLTLTLTLRQPSALVALSFAFESDFVLKFCSVHSIGYNFHSTFSLEILLRNHLLFLKFIPSVGSKQRATTTLDFEHVTRCSYFLLSFCTVSNPSTRFCFGYFNPVFSYIFGVCVTFQPTFDFCSGLNLPHLRQFVRSFALQWLLIPIHLRTSAHLTFGLCQPSLNLQAWLVMILPPQLLQQQLLRLNFVHTMRRNFTFGSASSRPSLQRRGSNNKSSNMPTLSPACPSKSFGTFWRPSLMSAATLTSRSTFWKILCLGNLERASGSPILNYFAFPRKCRASNLEFSWGSSNSISLQEFHLTTIFFFQCFWSAFCRPWEKQ